LRLTKQSRKTAVLLSRLLHAKTSLSVRNDDNSSNGLRIKSAMTEKSSYFPSEEGNYNGKVVNCYL